MKRITKLFYIFLILFINPIIVFADSGLDAKYDSGSVSDLIGSGSSFVSPVFKLLGSKPTDKDYKINYLIMVIICIILFYIFTNINVFKLNNKKKKTLNILGLCLIPTLVFSLLCLLIKLPLIIYLLIVILYITIFSIVTKKTLNKRLKIKIDSIKEIDKKFDIDKFNEKAFEIYKKVQIAWMDSKLYKFKKLISEEMYTKYEEQLNKLNSDKEKNIMDKIEYKSNKITDIRIEDNIEVIECEMNVSCIDYIIDNKDKVIKGKKDKKCNYTYKLVFNKNLDTNKYTLVYKKMKKQK